MLVNHSEQASAISHCTVMELFCTSMFTITSWPSVGLFLLFLIHQTQQLNYNPLGVVSRDRQHFQIFFVALTISIRYFARIHANVHSQAAYHKPISIHLFQYMTHMNLFLTECILSFMNPHTHVILREYTQTSTHKQPITNHYPSIYSIT